MPVLMYHGGVLNQGVKHTKCKKVYHKVVVIQWICLLKELLCKFNTLGWVIFKLFGKFDQIESFPIGNIE